MPDKARRQAIEPQHQKLSIVKQCELLGVNRASFYYQPLPVSESDLLLMDRIDEIYTEFPYYGYRKITAQLRREDWQANRKRIARLMRIMGLKAIVPKRNLSKAAKQNPRHPYLLKEAAINHPNHAWGTDITYIRAARTWFYLVAILDWYSRYVLAFRLSPSMSSDFCLDCLEEALQIGKPEIHNSDQGVQFTSEDYLSILKSYSDIKISMDGRGRCFDNIFTERLWRTVKYEEVYLHDYTSQTEAEESLGRYFDKYNHRRLHESLNYQTPAEVYFNQQINILPKVEKVSHETVEKLS